MTGGKTETKPRTRTSVVFVLGALALLASVLSIANTRTYVVPWCRYQHLVRQIACFAITAGLSAAWACVAFKCHRRIIGTIASVWASLTLLAALLTASGLHNYKMVPSAKFDDMMGAYRSARQALDASGHGEMVIFALSSYGRKIGGSCGNLQATGPNDSVYGSTGGDGVWTLKRERDGSSAIKAVKHNVAEVLEEVGKRRPDLTNGVYYMNAAWGNPSGAHWYGSVAGKGIWHLSDDFKKFEVWDENGTAVE